MPGSNMFRYFDTAPRQIYVHVRILSAGMTPFGWAMVLIRAAWWGRLGHSSVWRKSVCRITAIPAASNQRRCAAQ